MKTTISLIKKLRRLCEGESIPSSQLKGEWVDALLAEGLLKVKINGSKKVYKVSNLEAFRMALSRYDEILRDFDLAERIITGEASRGDQARDGGNSKLRDTRSCPGFSINCYEPISAQLRGKRIAIAPPEGSFMFINDWVKFTIPKDIVIVGIENTENFRMIRQQRKLFEEYFGKDQKLLFVSRYPQEKTKDLQRWLAIIPNRYVHFGDFDLSGIQIYQTQFLPYVGDRGSYLIPQDIGERLQHGTNERYDYQYDHTLNIVSGDADIRRLIDLINQNRRCYDQEGYIERTD